MKLNNSNNQIHLTVKSVTPFAIAKAPPLFTSSDLGVRLQGHMDKFELIAVIEVSENEKVLCQFENCGRPVFKRIHIVRNNEKIQVLGSECYKKQYGKYHASNKIEPIYGSNTGIALSETERSLLLENTEELIRQFGKKYQTNEELAEKKADDYSKLSDSKLRTIALEKTKEDFRINKGINPELPGWAGWVKSDAEELFKKLRGK